MPRLTMERIIEIEIDRIGARGDGIAQLEGCPIYVPFALPGERVRVRVTDPRGDGFAARILEILEPSPRRVAPPCPHFGLCGGCASQHMDDSTNALWKRGLLVQALSRVGFDSGLVQPLIAIPPGSRRRAALNFQRRTSDTILGYAERARHDLVDVAHCPVLAPEIESLIPVLRGALTNALPPGVKGRATLTLTWSGIDLLIETSTPLDLALRERLAALAETSDLARLSWSKAGGEAECVARRRPATVRFGDVLVEPPPGAFLQPSEAGEKAMVALVRNAVGEACPILDLFAGCGSLTFPLAERARIHAVEGRGESGAALKEAAQRSRLAVTVERRDLAKRPLSGDELAGYQALVFDPPSAGALPQARLIAESGPPIVVAVSCNPATLARDARCLAAGGYRLVRAVPLDQFPWTARLEAVAVFER